MFFITLVKWKRAPKKEDVDQFTKTLEELETQGIKMRTYWTLGRYDGLSIIEDRSIDLDHSTLLARNYH